MLMEFWQTIAMFLILLLVGLLYEFLKDLIRAKMAVKQVNDQIDAAIIKITRSVADLIKNRKEVNEQNEM